MDSFCTLLPSLEDAIIALPVIMDEAVPGADYERENSTTDYGGRCIVT
uniref:Putative pheromone n=1 Tax=Flammulina velutipes TaxID=38945 RepID=M4MED9_FLAVE|nr:putative pheromone precursor [Flammulina velutipes]QPK40839.1 putative pheromone precursor [Flammulina velutipes]